MEEYKQTIEEVKKVTEADPDTGLSSQEVDERRKKQGLNKFDEAPKESMIKKFFRSLSDFTTIILLVAAVISFYTAFATEHGDLFEGLLIIAIVVINSVLAIVQEGNAEKALESLQDMNKQTATVIRDGKVTTVESEQLVVGDILILESGDAISADARLIEASQLRVEESALTGESEAVEKDAAFIAEEDESLGDQLNMVFKGCTVAAGRGKAIVTAIGMATEMGKIADLLNENTMQKTPLQVRLNQLGKRISMIALAAAALVFVIGELQGEPLLEMFMTSISLAVAAVPETLTVIVTLTLAYGVQKMARKHAIIRQLPAVETLGTANVICSDKTGTLTQNEMRVRRVWSKDRFGNGVICCRGSNFIFCTRRTGVQRVTYFEGQTTTGIGDDVFHVQATNFRTQTVRELTFQQHFRLRNVATTRCQVVTAEIADAPFDVRVDDQVFLLFGHKAVGLVVHGLNTCVEHFHRFNERYLEMQTRLINQRFVVIVTQYLTKTQRNTALTFFDDKDRHVKHYQHDDDNRDN